MNTTVDRLEIDEYSLKYYGVLLCLVAFAVILLGRLVYFVLSDTERFPVNTIKVAASYEHVTHKQLETVLAQHLTKSFFSLSVTKLQNDLNDIPWVESAYVERIWPDTLKIRITERHPVAYWNQSLITENGTSFSPDGVPAPTGLPRLEGPEDQYTEVLHVYQKLSKILSEYNLSAAGLKLRANHSWVLVLTSGVNVYLGKKDIDVRLVRFCKAYPAVFSAKVDQLASVDLRYPRGMAVQWKQQTEQ